MPCPITSSLCTPHLFSLLNNLLWLFPGLAVSLVQYSTLLSLLVAISAQNVKWNLIDNFSFNGSYVMHLHPHRHQHLNNTPYNGEPTIGPHHMRPLRFVVLAPSGLHSTEDYSLEKIMPAIVAAVRSIEEEARHSKGQLYRGWEHGATIDFVDTKCSSAIGNNEHIFSIFLIFLIRATNRFRLLHSQQGGRFSWTCLSLRASPSSALHKFLGE